MYNFIIHVGRGECDFETNWCGWRENTTINNSRWYRTVDVGLISLEINGTNEFYGELFRRKLILIDSECIFYKVH